MKFLSHTAQTAGIALLLFLGCSAMPTLSQTSLAPNQTFGYGENQVIKFTYLQSFDCVDQPKDDLNFNGVPAESDPMEFQIPICQVGVQPTIDPTGFRGANDPTEPLYVLVPMFSVDNDQNASDAISCTGIVPGTRCGSALGSTLISLFGALPEAFKAKPLVYTQCPGPNLPPGTCTMHASRLDLGPVLVQLGYLPPPATNVFVPTPNHSHIVLPFDVNLTPIWWQVIPVLVLDQSDWPTADGSSGITSTEKMQAAENAGRAVQAPSNFYLFFGSQTTHHH
ncbi:MAG TPA: hypothetical protein VEE85_02315 [Candidatus Bathyarchaeia archaeon]|nr:hypothetical protein [Candidatus Bathyarchaeia archaeon]